jgi:hypothetical protein
VHSQYRCIRVPLAQRLRALSVTISS